jgi:hypothetical protein
MNEDAITLQDVQVLARQESAKLHHFFIGVEHLFIALTRLDGGLTTAVLEQHGLSPRFVRYSIRESVGRYENRRYWPGFPETPRATTVLGLAKLHAGSDEITERDLLLAIFDEDDSVVIRVLHEMGADPAALRETAASWTSPLRPQPREVPIRGDVALDPEQRRVLQLMFRDYDEIEIVRELEGGHSGARVFLVRPIRVGGHRDASVVVKLDERQAILYERRRYDLHVKDTLPATTARLLDAPIAPDKSWCAGLKYTFVGRLEDTEPVSLRELALRDPQKLGGLIRTLFDEFGPSWWLQRHPYRFGVWREYEHVLPPALIVEALPDGDAGKTGHVLTPLGAWSRNSRVIPGEIVSLNGFVVQKLDFEQDILYLAAGAQPEAINRAGKVEVRGLGLTENTFFRGEMIDQIGGRVVGTRDDLLRRSLQALEPDFDLRVDRIPSGHDDVPDLPNPLPKIAGLLDRQVSGYLSVIHGDLHLGNILVGPRGDAWLIDFAWTREGHTLFDWALLEISLLVEVVSRHAPPGWDGAWSIIKLLRSLNRGDDSVFQEAHQAGRALGAVKAVRDIVRECLTTSDRWGEYYIALSLLALRLMDWKSERIDARRLAFLVSALALAAVQSPRDVQTRSDQKWIDTATDVDKTDLQPGIVD